MTERWEVGGPLAIDCPTCRAWTGAPCRSRSKQPHDERIRAAPGLRDVHVGDLIILRMGLAEILGGDAGVLRIRRWLDASGTWADERQYPVREVRGTADLDDPRLARINAARDAEEGARR